MRPSFIQRQSGYALIMAVLLFMGAGGVVLSGFTQKVKQDLEAERYLHNQRVLEEAKHALLTFAYNYPEIGTQGPGRLPCPDTDNDGTPDTLVTCANFVGRLPWDQTEIDLYDIRDADGQRLWYAVSATFATQGNAGINSDTTGSVTVRGLDGGVIFDGSANNGVAAVIIAPGSAIDRNGVAQDRSVGNGDDPFDTTPDTAAGIVNPANYLDLLFGVEDNANLVQGDLNGLIHGPITDNNNTLLVNDQMIVITADEVIEMAEKRTLQAYREAINTYLGATGVYPWLYNFGVAGVANFNDFPASDLGDFATELPMLSNFGRVPSPYAQYFGESDSLQFESLMQTDYDFSFPAQWVFVESYWLTTIGPEVLSDTLSNASTAPVTLQFLDVPPENDDIALLQATVPAQTATRVIYFFNDADSPSFRWSLCPGGADEIEDCHRPTPGSQNLDEAEILRVTLELELNGVENFIYDIDTPPVALTQPATAGGHATITTTLQAGVNLVGHPAITASYEYDDEYGTSVTETFDVEESGNLNVSTINVGAIDIEMRYYPVLPDWVLGNNNWHTSMMMAYATEYRPDDLSGPCTFPGGSCLGINDTAGVTDDKISILIMAGENDWNDEGGDNLGNDLVDVFDGENATPGDNVFEARFANTNDRIMVIQEF